MLRKLFKILLRIVLVILLLLVLLYAALHFSPVQTWLVKKVSKNLSEKLHTDVKVNRVDFRFFNKILIEGVLVKDLKKDTLLSAGKISSNLNDWFFIKDKIILKDLELEDVVVNMKRSDSVWNYQFLVDYFSDPKKKKTGGKNVDIDLKELHFKNIKFNQLDGWRGQDMIAEMDKLDLVMKLIDLKNKNIEIKEILLDKPFFAQRDYKGNRPPKQNMEIIIEKIPLVNALQWNKSGWQLSLEKLDIKKGVFKNDKDGYSAPYTDRFDGQHLFFSKLNGTLKNVLFKDDTLKVKIFLSAEEKSGLIIKKLESNMKLTPTIMEFNNLDLITNNSRLGDYYAMEYKNFNEDFSSFIHNVSLNAKFKNSYINTDDIAIFAPNLKNWNRTIYIEGKSTGAIDNFSAKDLKIRSGNTFLDGNLALRGLPDISTTFIDLKSKSLQTNYNEITTFIPQIKEITNPALQKLRDISFVGDFTGFIKDFVVNGNINTGLGNIDMDVNMKIPESSPPKYSGSIASTGFNLGSFINTSTIGNVVLDVKINGTGFGLKDLKEKIDGNIYSLKFGNYTFKNIILNGDFENKLFMGHASINDPNLKISSLDGAISFTDKKPGFKLQAAVEKADLKSLGFVKDNFLFSGDLDLNFTGNNIDNFLGNATIKNAKLFQSENQLSFDFLNINSEIIGTQKSLTLNTNELDANVTGNFKIVELPDAVRILLAKYYPTYIQAPSYNVKSLQNFTYNLKTKNVEEYVKLLDKKLRGFNNSNFRGAFNLQAYDLQLKATIPQFTYDNKIFNNVDLNAVGNGERLLTDIAVAEIVINDSLQLPLTKLIIDTKNDVSLIKLNTSASKIFGDAELNASITTMSDGVKINFFPSSFIINNKKWQLEKDGELILSNNLFSASEVKFYSGNQEIILGTELDQDNSNTHLTAKLKNIHTEDFAFVLPKNPKLNGIITGQAKVSNILKNPKIEFSGFVDSTAVEGEYIGKLNIENVVLNTATGSFNYNVNINEEKNKLIIKGSGNYKDTTGNAFQTTAKIDNLNLSILRPYLKTVFTDIVGSAKGDIEIAERDGKMNIIGNPLISNGSLIVGYTQVKYNLDNQVVKFGKNSIELNDIGITDTLGNKGDLSGIIYHNFFNDFSFKNLSFSSKKMMLLNTTKKDNQQFYGKVIGEASMTLNGDIANMKMKIEGEPSVNDSSHVYLVTGENKEIGAIDYIDFIQFGSVMDKDISSKGQSNLLVELKLTANPSCKIDVILDEATGDVIKGAGNGELNIRVGTNEDLSIRGKYNITQGDYTFNFQTLIRRPFTVETGGSITWSGDPLLALLDLKAEYLVKNVDISSFAIRNDIRLQEDIIIKSHLTGSLKKPDVDFEFQLPENSASKKDFYVTKKLAQYRSDENELNKQVASLLLFGQFITNANTQSFLNGGSIPTIAAGTIGGIVSSWLTSLLNKQLEKATKGVVSFAVDLNPTINSQLANQLQANIRSSLQFKLSKNIRLLVGGNFDYNNPIAQLYGNANRITPDITIEWLINKDGSLRVLGSNKSTVDATTGQRNNSSIKLGYRKDVDRLGDIFRSKKRINELDSIRNSQVPINSSVLFNKP